MLIVVVAGCGPSEASVDDARDSQIERGRYLVNNVAQCAFCHTPLLPDGSRDASRRFAGDPCFIDTAPEDPATGCLPTRNLTPHITGLANASDGAIKMAIRDGIRTDGHAMAPVMPYWVFHNMTAADLDAVVAYLRTVTPVENMIPPRQAPWGQIAAPSARLDPATIPSPRAEYPEQARAERGRYLATMAGLCIDCHTVERPPGDPRAAEYIDRDHLLQGNRLFPSFALGLQTPPYPEVIFTANLTPDEQTGVGAYSIEDFRRLFRAGRDRLGQVVCAVTHGGPTSPYAALTDADIEDIGHYLLSIPPVAAAPAGTCTGLE